MLLHQERLLSSGVVANNRMNRERVCTVKNSYEQDLSFNPINFLGERIETKGSAAWLDLCCGSGRALIEAATVLFGEKRRLRIVGVDLIPMFQPFSSALKNLKLLQSSIEDFEPNQRFDLITCVHGLHYIGDKLTAIQKAVGWLKNDGVFLANLDLNNLKFIEEQKSNRSIIAFLRKHGFEFDSRKHLLARTGGKQFELSFEYVGADDAAGTNYTGQAAVNSYYRCLKRRDGFR